MAFPKRKILFCGALNAVGYPNWQRCEILRLLGFQVYEFDYTPFVQTGLSVRLWAKVAGVHFRFPKPAVRAFNDEFLNRVEAARPEIIWVEKALLLLPETLEAARKVMPRSTFVAWTDDNPFGRRRFEFPLWRDFVRSIAQYDLHFVKRHDDIANFKSHGARNVALIRLGYFLYHRPYPPEEIPDRCRHDTVFIGSAIDNRPASISYLVRKKRLPVDVYGWRWHRHAMYYRQRKLFHGPVFGPGYAQVVSGSKISLGYVSSSNMDEYTNRSADIPACGGFLLAQRTSAHEAMYEGGKEAEFFGSDDECAEKIRFYLRNDDARRRIARAGYERCLRSDYSLTRSVREALNRVLELRGEPAELP